VLLRICLALPIACLILAALPAQDTPSDLPPLDNAVFAEIAKRTGLYPEREYTGNAIADRKFKEEVDAFLATIPHRKVRWELPLHYVSEEVMRFKENTIPEKAQFPSVRFNLYLNPHEKTAETHPNECWIKGAFTVDQLEPLRAGDRVAVEGTIARFERNNTDPKATDASRRLFKITLTNVKLYLPRKDAKDK